MTGDHRSPTIVTFGDFRLDLPNAELSKHGIRIRLRHQPARVLALLATHSAEIVSRDELQRAIWGSDTFVDFERGLNNCVKEIREALNDEPEHPKYIETIPRRGYRFMAHVEIANVLNGNGATGPDHAQPVASAVVAREALPEVASETGKIPKSKAWIWTVIAVVIIGGVAATVYEARLARAERLRAEAHFKEVRALANSLMFDVHDSIQNLPGSTPARKMLVERAITQLDSLSRDGASDASLQRDLATAYEKAGTVQGNPFGANLGDTQGGLDSYQKAFAIRESLVKENPKNINDKIALARIQRLTAELLANRGDSAWANEAKQGLATAEEALNTAPSNSAVLQELQSSYYLLGIMMDSIGDYEAAADYLQKELPIAQELLEKSPDDQALRREPGRVEAKLGYALARMGSRTVGMGHARRGVQILQSLAVDENDVESSRWLGMARWMMGDILLLDGNAKGALENYEEQRRIAKKLATADPANAVVQYDLGCASARAGNATALTGEPAAGLKMLNQAARMFEVQVARDPAYVEPRYCLAATFVWMGEVLARTGDTAQALENYRKGLTIWQVLAAHNKGGGTEADAALFHARVGGALAKLGRSDSAARELKEALDIVKPVTTATPALIEAHYVIADVYSAFGEAARLLASSQELSPSQQAQHWNDAREWYQRSLAAWGGIQNPAARTPVGFAISSPEAVKRELAACDVAYARLKPRNQ